jgi:hypothetical protein
MDSFIINLRDASDGKLLSIADRCERWLDDPNNRDHPRRDIIAEIAAEALTVLAARHDAEALDAADDGFTESAHQYGVTHYMETA